jgi:hypothetical protein
VAKQQKVKPAVLSRGKYFGLITDEARKTILEDYLIY